MNGGEYVSRVGEGDVDSRQAVRADEKNAVTEGTYAMCWLFRWVVGRES